jgi:hypothetical protein
MNALREAVQALVDHWDTPLSKPTRYTSEYIDALRAALAQPEPFNPDWDRIEALEESLREHMAEIHRLKALAQQPQQTAMPPDIAKVLFDHVESLYVEDAQPPTKWTPMSEKDEPVAWGCFRNGVLLDDLVSDEASVDYWCASDEPEMQGLVKRALYTAPPQRGPLTDERINEIAEDGLNGYDRFTFARAIEKAHGIGVEG